MMGRCLAIAAALLSACAPVAVPLPGPPDGMAMPAAAFAGAVGYIDAGVKYIDPLRAFFVAADGELCFRGAKQSRQVEYGNPDDVWCMPAREVNNVDALANDVSYIPVIRLWCRHEAPYCARKFGPVTWYDPEVSANSITVEIAPHVAERAAVAHLVELMGGRLELTQALR